jgi:aldose 1-epimerase
MRPSAVHGHHSNRIIAFRDTHESAGKKAPMNGRDARGEQRSAGFSSSGYLTPVLVGALCIGLLIASYERGHGHFHQIMAPVTSAPPPPAAVNAPGGQNAIVLNRTALGVQPEFVSATLLPGRGLEVLQITASIPGRGQVPLLVAPSLQDAVDEWTDTGVDAHGALGATTAAAFLVPWAGRLFGSPGSQPGTIQMSWHGLDWNVPAEAVGGSRSTEGLVLDRSVDAIHTSVLPDGQALEATLHAGTFDGSWPSSTDVDYRVELTGRAIEITVTATNRGTKPEPMGIGWKPHFAIPSGNRAAATLTLPSTMLVATDPHSGAPTGSNISADETGQDFVRAAGTPLGARNVDGTWTNLLRGTMADGAIAQLRDPDFNYSLRLIILSPDIQWLHVEAANGKPWVMIAPETNPDDPTGPQWHAPDDRGLIMLQPGASLTWKVRLEISTTVIPGVPLATGTPSPATTTP